jgi:hypothetical protein
MKKKAPRDTIISLEPLMGHLLVTPSHNALQKIIG